MEAKVMKFSVLLPTRNRLEYLKYAITSIVEQDYDDWEIIISDNCSEEKVEDYIRSLSESRIKYFRTQSFCPVTENWNNALEKSTGDYVIMLGDDDCLLKGYFKTCAALLQQHNLPDMIYNSAMNYVYPNVMLGAPQGYLMQFGYAPFLVKKQAPFILDKQETLQLVRETFNFNLIVNFNMQHSLVSRSLINKMQNYGKFYQSPYPDYYATTSLLIKAQRILAVPYPMVVIGVTTKSFGYYFFNNKEKEGIEFLRNTPDAAIYSNVAKFVIPGTDMNISWLFSLETVRQNFHHEYKLKLNYKKFRFLQVLQQYKKFACQEGLAWKDMLRLAKSLFWWEKIVYMIPFFVAVVIRLHPRKTFGKTWASKMAYKFSHPSHGTPRQLPGQYNNILDVFHQNSIDLTQ